MCPGGYINRSRNRKLHASHFHTEAEASHLGRRLQACQDSLGSAGTRPVFLLVARFECGWWAAGIGCGSAARAGRDDASGTGSGAV